ncbi:hypothetical protein P9486_27495, partial [Escherichia coli]
LPPGWPGPGALPPHEREEFARHWRRALAGAGEFLGEHHLFHRGQATTPVFRRPGHRDQASAGAPERAENDLLGIDL